MKTHLTTILLGLALLPISAMAQTFSGESVEYDSIGQRYFTSDDGTSIVQRAYDGTVSHFGQGLSASYGMEVMGNRLYALSGSNLYAYDLTTATQVAAIPIANAGFLNGLASDGTNRLWATDFSAGKIYQIDVTDISAPVVSTIVANYGGTPNGIVYDGANNRLVVVSWGSNAAVKAVDLANSNALSTLVTTALTNIDGIDLDGHGQFYLASWSPDRITRYNNDFTQATTISVSGLNNPADICYATATDTLAIPNTGGNNTLFVGFQQTPNAINVLPSAIQDLSVSPNPLSAESQIHFYANESASVSGTIRDVKGRVVYTITERSVMAGANTIALNDFEGSVGAYYLTLTLNNSSVTYKLIKI